VPFSPVSRMGIGLGCHPLARDKHCAIDGRLGRSACCCPRPAQQLVFGADFFLRPCAARSFICVRSVVSSRLLSFQGFSMKSAGTRCIASDCYADRAPAGHGNDGQLLVCGAQGADQPKPPARGGVFDVVRSTRASWQSWCGSASRACCGERQSHARDCLRLEQQPEGVRHFHRHRRSEPSCR